MKGFVTVAEFLENGGELKNKRQLYSRKHADAPFKTVGWYVKNHPEHSEMFIMGNIGSTFPYYSNQAYVEIEVTPIYK